jgi:hypothetical protein
MRLTKKYWFPAKRYGWGWGFPTTWQGWLVLIAYAFCLGLLAHFFPPRSNHTTFVLGVVGLSVLLTAICWCTGEPPHWRWGNRQ